VQEKNDERNQGDAAPHQKKFCCAKREKRGGKKPVRKEKKKSGSCIGPSQKSISVRRVGINDSLSVDEKKGGKKVFKEEKKEEEGKELCPEKERGEQNHRIT